MKTMGRAMLAVFAAATVMLLAGCGEKPVEPADANKGQGQATETVNRRSERAIHEGQK